MKRIITFILLLIAITGFAQKKTYRIGIMADTYSENIKTRIYKALQHEITAVVGEDANIVFGNEILTNDYNIEKAKSNYNTLLKNSDIILSFGEYNNIVINQYGDFPKPVIAIGDLRQDATQEITKNTHSGRHNLLYLSSDDNLFGGLEILKQLSNFKTVGIVLEEQMTKAFDFKAFLDANLQGTDIQYKLIPYKNVSDIIRQLDGVDAIDLYNSFPLSHDEIKELAQVLIEKKIPSFSATRRVDVENGIMATNVSSDDYTRFFRRIALSIEAYVNGTNFSELPVLINYSNNLTINRNTALAIDVPFNYNMMGNIEFVGQISTNPKAEKVYNLPNLINEVLNKNLSLLSSKKGVAIKEQSIKSAKSNYLPSVKASASGVYVDPKVAEVSNGQNPEIKTSGNITLQQLLFSADANANIKIQKSLAKAQREKFNTEQLDIIFNTSNTYFNVLKLKTNVEIQTRNLELTKKNLQIAEENYKAGQSGKTDLLRFRSQKAQNTQSLIEAINQLKQAYIVVNQLTNNDLDAEIDVKDANLKDDIFKDYNYDEFMNWAKTPSIRKQFISFLVQEAINNAPEIKQLAYNLEATEQQMKLYGAGRFLPTVALQGQYNHEFSRSGKGTDYPAMYPTLPKGYYNAGVSVSLPIFNKNSNKINRQTALLQKEQLEVNKENIEDAITANMHKGILDLINKMTNIELSKVSEESAKEALDLTQTAYSTGAVNIVQLIDAQNNYLNAQQAKANATYNYLLKMLQLERYMGNYFLLNSEQDIIEFNQRFLEFTKKE